MAGVKAPDRPNHKRIELGLSEWTSSTLPLCHSEVLGSHNPIYVMSSFGQSSKMNRPKSKTLTSTSTLRGVNAFTVNLKGHNQIKVMLLLLTQQNSVRSRTLKVGTDPAKKSAQFSFIEEKQKKRLCSIWTLSKLVSMANLKTLYDRKLWFLSRNIGQCLAIVTPES